MQIEAIDTKPPIKKQKKSLYELLIEGTLDGVINIIVFKLQ